MVFALCTRVYVFNVPFVKYICVHLREFFKDPILNFIIKQCEFNFPSRLDEFVCIGIDKYVGFNGIENKE